MSTVAAIGAIAAVVGTAVQVDASRDAAKARKEQNAVSTATQKSEDASQLRKQARQARVDRARILQSAEVNGGGSREGGAISSLATQLGDSRARVAGQANAAGILGGLSQDIADTQVQSALGGVAKSVGSFAFSESGGFDSLFKGT